MLQVLSGHHCCSLQLRIRYLQSGVVPEELSHLAIGVLGLDCLLLASEWRILLLGANKNAVRDRIKQLSKLISLLL